MPSLKPQTIEFVVQGPYVIDRKGTAGRIIDAVAAKDLWTRTPTLDRLATERGCYVFATRHQGGGLLPWYIGMTTRSFRQECLNAGNQNHLNSVLFDQSGRLVLILIEYVRKKGPLNGRAILELENQLIGLAYKRNPDLINSHGTKVGHELVIRGAMNSRSRASQSAKVLKATLGLP